MCSGVNIPFDITAGKGPIIADPIRTMEASASSSFVSGLLGLFRLLWVGQQCCFWPALVVSPAEGWPSCPVLRLAVGTAPATMSALWE